MGAGDCPEDAKAHLLRQVLDLNLGFSDAQLRRAVNHLVKEIGSSEEALAWIPRDNFTLLVNYVLDNDADLELRAPVQVKETRKMGNKDMSLAQEGNMGTGERIKGESAPTKGKLKRSLNVSQSCGNAPLRMEQSRKKVEQHYIASPPQRCLVDRNELHKHYKKKLHTDIVNVSDHITNSQVNKVLLSTTQTEKTDLANPSSHFSTNKKSRSSLEQAEQIIPDVTPLQRINSVAKSEIQKTGKERDSEWDSSIGKSRSSQKTGKIPEREATKERVWEARTSIPSGCRDLATDPGCPQVVRNRIFSHNQCSMAANDYRSQIDTVAQQSGERKAPGVSHDVDEPKEISGMSTGRKNTESRATMRGPETRRAEILLPNNDRQKASCSALNEGTFKGEQGHYPYNPENSLLLQLEGFLKEGNCERALEVFKAWKQKREPVKTLHFDGSRLEGREHEMVTDIPGKKRGFVVSFDISRGLEKFPISCVNEYNTDVLPENFLYITRSVIRQAAHVDISFSRIGDLSCCCSNDCLRSSEACKCTDSTRGEFAYDQNGRLIERLATTFQSGCNTENGDFITECCDKCRCSMNCGNRIVQRGVTRKLQVFMTPTNKGWGVRALETIPARSFLFEYLGEIATNLEQFDRNIEYEKNGVFTYTMCLDADLDMEKNHFKEGLDDNEALVLDATIYGNVSRFVNHRCNDANLFMRPVQVETRDTHYYHAAFFAARDIQEMEELTWDYGIDFEDNTHSLKAFECHCRSALCRDKESPFNREKPIMGKTVNWSHSKHKVPKR